MSLVNYYEKIPSKLKSKVKNPRYEHHHLEVPFRIGIIGSSGSGKTNLLLNLIHETSGTYQHVYLVIPSGAEPLYEHLAERLKDQFTLCEGIDNTPLLDSLPEYDSALIVFDDLAPESQKKQLQYIVPYFIRGRKKNLSCIYISQNFFSLPKIVRGQLGYVFIKKISSKRDCTAVIRDCSLDLNKEELIEVYNDCVVKKNSFLLIDLLTPNIRCGFREILS